MIIMFKVFQRIFLDKRFWFRRKKFVIIAFITILTIKIIFFNDFIKEEPCTEIDVVYTWVNGTDPEFKETIKKYKETIDPARFDDKNELKYSLRSLKKYAPWICNVYIVTNGQIPSWLNLNYERVKVIQHDELVPNSDVLPTFSSSAIETFIHRIPNLSKRFLYLNDDIFLNSFLYPEDLYTESNGVNIYNAWSVPDCAPDCPWIYIGDGSCDEHCNISICQFDGGDCSHISAHSTTGRNRKTSEFPAETTETQNKEDLNELKFRKKHPFKLKSFMEIIKKVNITNNEQLNNIVKKYNKKKRQKLRPVNNKHNERNIFESSKNIYTYSLLNTNMILNINYGFKARSVLAHVGFLLDRDIIYDMERKFHKEIIETRSRRFRDEKDVQFSFLYYNFVMSETYNLTISEIFDEFDTDKSNTWSDREIRTLLTRLYPLPMDWASVHYFEEVVNNCSRNYKPQTGADHSYTTVLYERYEDSHLPTITKDLVINCRILSEALLVNFGLRQKYKFYTTQKRGGFSNFVMLTSNISNAVDSLDRLRRYPRKFNCINDNLEPEYDRENQIIKSLLEDFYLSFFPERSEFELPDQYKNRFTYLNEYRNWKIHRQVTLLIGYLFTIILIIFVLKCCFYPI